MLVSKFIRLPKETTFWGGEVLIIVFGLMGGRQVGGGVAEEAAAVCWIILYSGEIRNLNSSQKNIPFIK
jgi:hypothetical protein